MDIQTILITFGAVVVFLIGFFGANYFQKRAELRAREQRKKYSDMYIKRFTTNYDKLWDKYIDLLEVKPENKVIFYEFKESSLNNWRNILSHYALPSYKTKEVVEKVVEEKINEIKKRLDDIEARFPKEATLDKLASINDAILGTQVETLTESLRDIREKMLTRWDVVKVVFAVLSALGVIVAIIFGIISLT